MRYEMAERLLCERGRGREVVSAGRARGHEGSEEYGSGLQSIECWSHIRQRPYRRKFGGWRGGRGYRGIIHRGRGSRAQFATDPGHADGRAGAVASEARTGGRWRGGGCGWGASSAWSQQSARAWIERGGFVVLDVVPGRRAPWQRATPGLGRGALGRSGAGGRRRHSRRGNYYAGQSTTSGLLTAPVVDGRTGYCCLGGFRAWVLGTDINCWAQGGSGQRRVANRQAGRPIRQSHSAPFGSGYTGLDGGSKRLDAMGAAARWCVEGCLA